jgi:lysophospholipase L1-like esterase
MQHWRTTALAVGFAVLALLLAAAGAGADSYVALGDSFSSGVGTRSFYESTCRRSEYAYPRLVATHRAGTSLTFRACSGATTGSVTSEQLGALSSTTNIVTITVGGNDAGFGHAICSSSEWLNGLSNPVEESFHPNRAGHASGYEPLVRSVIG